MTVQYRVYPFLEYIRLNEGNLDIYKNKKGDASPPSLL